MISAPACLSEWGCRGEQQEVELPEMGTQNKPLPQVSSMKSLGVILNQHRERRKYGINCGNDQAIVHDLTD
jgi:hypothetical protein